MLILLIISCGCGKRAVTTADEAKKHVEGQKSFFTAALVAAKPIVILVDLNEIFPTHIGSSGQWESCDERLLTARRQIHRELVLAGPGLQKAHRETTFQGFAPFRTHLKLYYDGDV